MALYFPPSLRAPQTNSRTRFVDQISYSILRRPCGEEVFSRRASAARSAPGAQLRVNWPTAITAKIEERTFTAFSMMRRSSDVATRDRPSKAARKIRGSALCAASRSASTIEEWTAVLDAAPASARHAAIVTRKAGFRVTDSAGPEFRARHASRISSKLSFSLGRHRKRTSVSRAHEHSSTEAHSECRQRWL